MVDRNTQLPNDDEYHLPEEHFSPEAEGSPSMSDESMDAQPSKKNRFVPLMDGFRRFKNKRILIVAIVVIIAAIGLAVLHNQQQEIPVQTTETSAPQPVASQTNMNLNALENSSLEQSSQMNALKSQVIDLQNSVSRFQTQNESLQNKVDALTEQMSDISNKFNNLLENMRNLKFKGRPPIMYHIRAIIPDRAWLVSNDGHELTVTVGNPVQGYGVVNGIDPQQGIVNTSSGRKIFYGMNDF